tara:strand:- start:1092 stop:1193 length:102 start_codon:yes stop_codon:yes gene_type:complete
MGLELLKFLKNQMNLRFQMSLKNQRFLKSLPVL